LRALAKIYIEQQHYPIKMLHQYSVPALAFREFCGEIMDVGAALLPGMPRKRAETLAYAAIVLRRLIKVGQPEQLVFSMQGIREGLLYQRLVKDRVQHDPLMVVAEELTACHGGDVAFGRLLDRWMQPAFAQKNDQPRWAELRRAASLLVTIPLYELSAERSELAFYSVLQAPLMAISHAERFVLSLAVMFRYQHAAPVPLEGWEQLGTSAEDHLLARKIGALMHLAYTISGGVGAVLEHTKLRFSRGQLTLSSDDADLCGGEMVQKRLQRAAALFTTGG
jgi:exopolyphosphatase/guanosine-5'-triphosphate,3'-diphosphate pyrophosphatase